MTRKLKLMTVLGTRPEIIRLSAVMRCADRYFDHVVVHTGQNYDPALNEVFFRELGLQKPRFLSGCRRRGPGRNHGQHHCSRATR